MSLPRPSESDRSSVSESENMSIGGSIDSVGSLGMRGSRGSRAKRIIYEASEMDDSDTHSELDVDLYDTDEVFEVGRTTSYRISLGSDGFESILSAPNSPQEPRDEDEFTLEPGPGVRRANPAFDSFVSVDRASELSESRPLPAPKPLRPPQPSMHFKQLQEQQQRLQTLQMQQQQQIQQQQQRYPGAYEAATVSSTSFYASLRQSLALVGGAPPPPRPVEQTASRTRSRPASNLLLDFTNEASPDALATPKEAFEPLGTPPGEPTSWHPGLQHHGDGANPYDAIHAQALEALPRSMNPMLLVPLLAVGFALGLALQTTEPPAALGFWVDRIGQLYLRLVSCVAVPMGVCQVIFSVATLSSRHSLWRLWLKTIGFFLLISVLSLALSVAVSAGMRSWLQPHAELDLLSTGSVFGLQCVSHELLALTDDALACSAVESSNATALRLVDVNNALGLPETVRAVGFTHYVFALSERYFPSNVTQALSEEHHVSAFVMATVLGVAMARSFRSSGQRNPLLRLTVHLYAALFTLLDWLQPLALAAAVPVTMGAVLAHSETRQLSLRFWLASALLCALQSLVLCPLVFYVVTRRSPFGWLVKVLPALLHALLLGSPVLPLAVATKTVLRSREVSPAVLGALFPVLAAMNRLAQALLLPLAILLSAGVADCATPLAVADAFQLLGFGLVASLGDTALPHAQLVYFLTAWEGICGAEDVSAGTLALAGGLLMQQRLTAVTNTATNVMLVRMAACTDEGRFYAQQYAL